MPPAGPVYLSIPLDDWNVPYDMSTLPKPRLVSTRFAPDPEQLAHFVREIRGAKKLGLVLGAEVDRSSSWDSAIALAELLEVPVFQSPLADRAVFPETHRLFKGALPSAIGPMADVFAECELDLVLVVGAEVWRFYPWVPSSIEKGPKILQITTDPHDAAAAIAGMCP